MDSRALALRISWPEQRDLMRPAQGAKRDAFLHKIGTRPLLMGIVNVTPDSFSDGGLYHDPRVAADRALEMAAAGADLIDIGGESTRPYATPVSLADELSRVLAVVKLLAGKLPVPISIDTTKAAVARAAGGQASPPTSGGAAPVRQGGSARRQRGWNGQPEGRAAGLGGSLEGTVGARAPPRRGTDASSAWV